MPHQRLRGLRVGSLSDKYFNATQQFAQFNPAFAAVDRITNRLCCRPQALRYVARHLLADLPAVFRMRS